MSAGDEGESVWVRTQPSASGKTYVVTIDFTDDLSTTLKPSEAETHARYVLASAARAAHDAAVFEQLAERGLARDHVVATIVDIRADRPELRAPAHLQLAPGVTADGKPFLTLTFPTHPQPAGQWSIEAAREHAHAVLLAVSVADLDAAYHRHLVGSIGLPDETARAAVGDLLGRVDL